MLALVLGRAHIFCARAGMIGDFTSVLSVGSGVAVGAVVGLLGGGGSVLAVPLLVYVAGLSSPHIAIGTSAVAVAVGSFLSALGHARVGNLRWRTALVFGSAGVLGALLGAASAKGIDGSRLLLFLGLLMVVVGLRMFLKRENCGDPDFHLTRSNAPHLVPILLASGLCSGAISGFFGISGGFFIVPALLISTGMTLPSAIGTSLAAATIFAGATAGSYVSSGMVDWTTAALMTAGVVVGCGLGIWAGRRLARRHAVMNIMFACAVIAAGSYMIWRELPRWLGA